MKITQVNLIKTDIFLRINNQKIRTNIEELNIVPLLLHVCVLKKIMGEVNTVLNIYSPSH